MVSVTKFELGKHTLVARTDRIYLSVIDEEGDAHLVTEDEHQFFLLMWDEIDRSLAGGMANPVVVMRCKIGAIVNRLNPFDNMPGFEFNYFELRLWNGAVDINLTRPQMVKLSAWMTEIYNNIPERETLTKQRFLKGLVDLLPPISKDDSGAYVMPSQQHIIGTLDLPLPSLEELQELVQEDYLLGFQILMRCDVNPFDGCEMVELTEKGVLAVGRTLQEIYEERKMLK